MLTCKVVLLYFLISCIFGCSVFVSLVVFFFVSKQKNWRVNFVYRYPCHWYPCHLLLSCFPKKKFLKTFLAMLSVFVYSWEAEGLAQQLPHSRPRISLPSGPSLTSLCPWPCSWLMECCLNLLGQLPLFPQALCGTAFSTLRLVDCFCCPPPVLTSIPASLGLLWTPRSGCW